MRRPFHVTPKKSLGQHFLTDISIATDIVDALTFHHGYTNVLEIGPGTGVLTQFLLQKKDQGKEAREGFVFKAIEIDRESIAFLKIKFPELDVLSGDFLKMDLSHLFDGKYGIIGNFPYNISSQIFFTVLDHRDEVQEVVCMLQKEVAERLCSGPGSRDYGILSVFLQVYYDLEYLFTVDEHVFNPPPKVKSAVIRATRNLNKELGCNEVQFRKVVKQAFSTRRKMLRNCFKGFGDGETDLSLPIFDKRAEQLGIDDYVRLTKYFFPE